MVKDTAHDTRVIDELRRRKVLRTTTIYAVLGWCLLQWCNVFFIRLGWPEWTVTLVLTAVVLGFPVMVALSWAFDITPQGVQWSDIDHAPHRQTTAVNHLVSLGVLSVLIVTLLFLAAQ